MTKKKVIKKKPTKKKVIKKKVIKKPTSEDVVFKRGPTTKRKKGKKKPIGDDVSIKPIQTRSPAKKKKVVKKKPIKKKKSKKIAAAGSTTARTSCHTPNQSNIPRAIREDVATDLRTRSPKLKLAFAIGDKVYLHPGRVYTQIRTVYLSADGIVYQCATGPPVTADMLECAAEHKRRGF